MARYKNGIALDYDWPKLHKQWECVTDVTLREWSEAQGLRYDYASRKFSELDREYEARQVALARRKLARTSPQAADKIGELLDSQDANIALRASIANLGMVGISAQAQGQQSLNVQINMPAMFASNDNAEDLKQLLQGGKSVKTIENE